MTGLPPPKFGASSFYSDGSGGITISGSADGRDMDELAFGTGDFTVEYWVRFEDITTSTYHELVDFRQAANSETQIMIYTDGSARDVRYYIAGADRIDVPTIINNDVWQHHALVRYNAVTTFYIDGKSRGTYADTNNITVAPNAIHFGRVLWFLLLLLLLFQAFVVRPYLVPSSPDWSYPVLPGPIWLYPDVVVFIVAHSHKNEHVCTKVEALRHGWHTWKFFTIPEPYFQ